MPLTVKRRGRIWWMRGTVAGRRIHESTRTDNETIAQQIAAKREAELWESHLYGAERVVTMAQAIVKYIEAGGERRFLGPILDAWGTRRLSSIRPGHVRDLAKKLYPNAIASTRNRQVITPVVAIINCAAERGLAKPIKVKRFPEAKPKRRAVDREWIDAFRDAARIPYLRALALFMFTTSARISESVELEPDDIDLHRRVAYTIDTKNGDPHEYHLTTEMVVELANLKPRNGRVFGYKSRQSVYGPWGTACKRAGIEYIPPHQAGRHTFATELITRRGVDAATVGRLGNWKSLRLLLETYAHPIDDASVVDEYLAPHNGPSVAHPAKSNERKR